MRLTTFILLATFMQVSASGFAQKVTLTEKNAALKNVIDALRKQSKYNFLYTDQALQNANRVDLQVQQMEFKEVLVKLFKDQPLTYTINNNTVIIKEKKASVLDRFIEVFASTALTGKITDEKGLGLPGVSVQIKSLKLMVQSSAAGEYRFVNVPKGKYVVTFTMIGYQTENASLSMNETDATLNVSLKQQTMELDETVIIGYGKTTRRENTGAVSSITANEIGKQTIDNPLLALQGRIPGMQIAQDNGLPGAGVRVNIRGASTGISNAGFIPLYIIDGVPFTLFNGGSPASDNLNAYGTSGANGGVSPFSMIAPEDIERIDVLKDADATAIYGSRGSNGVVLITTKKGSKGKTTFNVNINHGVQDVAHFLPMMNTQQYLDMRRAAFAKSGVTPTATNAPDLTVWDQNANTDWQKYFIGHTANTTNATASVSGGNEQNSFLFSSTYRKQGTVFGGDLGATTYSGRLTAGHKSMDGRFSIDGSVNYSLMNNLLPVTDLSSIYNLAPNYPLYSADGSVNWNTTSPLSYAQRSVDSKTTNLLTNLNLSYKLLKGLTLKTNLGYSLTSLKQLRVNPASSQNPAGTQTSTLNYADNDNDNYIIEPQAEYITKIGEGQLQALLGTTFQKNKSEGISLTATGYTNEAMIRSLVGAALVTTNYNNNSTYKYNAFFGRLNYNWKGKYIVDGTFRRDGSSRFGENNRFGNFGAAGASWIFTKEDFMKDLTFLSFGKLRASYGVTGNDQIPDYQYFSLYAGGGSSYAYNGTPIFVASNIANPDLKWETTRKLDIAMELGFFSDRILLKADYYRNRTADPLNYITVPAQVGTTSYLGNLGAEIQNKGFEFELNTTNIEMKDFRWTTSLNLTINRNKLLSFDNLENSSYRSTYIVGQPTDIRKMYKYTGVDPQTGSPTYQDLNGDGLITFADDRYVVDYGTPYYGGITNSFTYKGFQLDFSFQYNHRNGYLNSTLTSSPAGSSIANQSLDLLNRWNAVGDMALYPAASSVTNTAYGNLSSSDVNWGDASYLKLKTVSLNYALPKNMVSKLNLSALTVYVQGQNLYTWAKQKYVYDPESTPAGTGAALGVGQYIAFPQLRTVVIGLNCSF